MKNIIWIYTLISLSLIVFIASSCKKDSNTNDPNKLSDTVSTLSATIVTMSYLPTYVDIIRDNRSLTIISFTGYQSLNLYLYDTITIGTHPLNGGIYSRAMYSPNNSNYFFSDSGTVDILEYDTVNWKIKGTFNFVGKEFGTSINVTNGAFEIFD